MCNMIITAPVLPTSVVTERRYRVSHLPPTKCNRRQEAKRDAI
jgi:hypothetical protein